MRLERVAESAFVLLANIPVIELVYALSLSSLHLVETLDAEDLTDFRSIVAICDALRTVMNKEGLTDIVDLVERNKQRAEA